ncbi:hypothetical protein D3C81_1901560 [compost metagenome]
MLGAAFQRFHAQCHDGVEFVAHYHPCDPADQDGFGNRLAQFDCSAAGHHIAEALDRVHAAEIRLQRLAAEQPAADQRR